jgi:PKD repeat protein
VSSSFQLSGPLPHRRSRGLRATAAAIAAVVAVSASVALTAVAAPTSASADTKPPSAATPQTVSSDGLPTAQIGTGTTTDPGDYINGGVVWDQAIVGETVYVGGHFQRARQAGQGADKAVERQNFLAYNLKTGALLDLTIPFNAEIRALAVSPDQTRLYVAGYFTQVAGQKRERVAAIDIATGTVVADFAPSINKDVKAIVATKTRVFIGGAFANADGASGFHRVASLTLDGQVDRSWNPQPRVDPAGVPQQNMTNGQPIQGSDVVQALIASPDGTKIVIGGHFNSLNGSDPRDATKPGYGMGMVRADNAAMLSWNVNTVIRNGTQMSGIMSLSTDGDFVYGTGMWSGYYKGGHFEGTFKASWADGRLDWMEDCHGDTYSTYAHAGVVYKASHAHACDTLGGFPENTQTDGYNKYYRGLALTQTRTGTLTPTPDKRYWNFGGNPAPSLLNWFPNLRASDTEGQMQAARDVTGAGDYVVMGGEFSHVNGVPQQGLVRFASSSVAPNKQGPVDAGADMVPSATGIQGTYVRLAWKANWDTDNAALRYDVFRDGDTSNPVFTKTVESNVYTRPTVTATDGYLTPGRTYSYRVRATDPFGNETWGDAVTYTVPQTAGTAINGQRTGYDSAVLADQPAAYWPMNEQTGGTAFNWAGTNDIASLRARVPGPEVSSFPKALAYTLAGSNWAATAGAEVVTPTFTTELWFKTRTTAGGVLAVQTTTRDLTSGYDRVMYMDAAGKVHFSANDGANKNVTSTTALNDGKWHHVAATVGSAGATLYVDGVARASRTDLKTGATFGGKSFWAVGGHKITWRTSAPAGNAMFTGAIDNVASYSRPLTAAQVAAHYAAGTTKNAAPTASFSSDANGLALRADASTSSDRDGGIASYAWNFGDGTIGTGVAATHTYAASGTYTVTLTVKDTAGASATTSASVVIDGGKLAADAFERTSGSTWGSADPGGAWSTNTASGFTTAGGKGVIAGAGTRTATLPGVSAASTESVVTFSIGEAATSPQYVSLIGRQVGSDSYSARTVVQTDGKVQLQLLHGTTALTIPVNGKNADRFTLPGVTAAPGQQITVRLRAVSAQGSTTLEARAWLSSAAEPAAWQAVATDGTPALQAAGSVGLGVYSKAPATVSFDAYSVRTTP